MILVPLEAATDERCGGKARVLRLLLEAGLDVPAGLCVPVALFEEAAGPRPEAPPAGSPPASLAELFALFGPARAGLAAWSPGEDLLAEAAALARPLIARSSAACEGLEGGAFAGAFSSTGGISDAAGLAEGIRVCFASLFEVPGLAALSRAGRWPGRESMAVILEEQVEAAAAGTLLSRDPSSPSLVRVEAVRGQGCVLADGLADPECRLVPRVEADLLPEGYEGEEGELLAAGLLLALRELALRAEGVVSRALGRDAVAEVEWVLSRDGRLFVVQARESRAASPKRRFQVVFRRERDRRTRFRWDREHNPEPLSPAHASLVELVDGGEGRTTVQGGYLYGAVEGCATARHASTAEAGPPGARPRPRPGSADLREFRAWELGQRELLRGAEAAVAARSALGDPAGALEAALDFFRSFARSYFAPPPVPEKAGAPLARLGALLARAGSPASPAELALLAVGERHSALDRAQTFRAAGRDRASAELLETGRFVWDVAAPSLAEWAEGRSGPAGRPAAPPAREETPSDAHLGQRRRSEELAGRIAAGLPLGERAALGRLLEEARLARLFEEDDDLCFARALGLVRRALLAAGAALGLSPPGEVFLLGVGEVLALLGAGTAPGLRGADLPALLAARRAAWEASRGIVPPLSIFGDELAWPPPPEGRAVLRGLGTSGVARGRVLLARRLEELLERDVASRVVVCKSLSPALSVVLPAAAALVTDHGGLLSHAASLARELGKVAVVGTRTATSELEDGEPVWVDGDRGLVVREGSSR